MFSIVGGLDSSCNICTLYHQSFPKQILSALFLAFCLTDLTVYDLLSQQAFAYRNKGRIQDLYSRRKFSCSTLRLLRRHSWNTGLFALVVISLQCSFQFRCGVMVIPMNLTVFASSVGFPLILRLIFVCLFEGFLNSMFFVLVGLILIFSLSHHFMSMYITPFKWSLEFASYQPTGF